MAIGVQVTFDATDPGRLAAFWGEALGYAEQPPPPGFATWEDFGRHIDLPEERWGDFAALVDPDGVGPRLFFQRVPEGKTAKNRVHLDLNVGAEVSDPEQRRPVVRRRAEQLVAAGGAVVREVDEPGGWCVVMTDPEASHVVRHSIYDDSTGRGLLPDLHGQGGRRDQRGGPASRLPAPR